jgi:hypothetical protein
VHDGEVLRALRDQGVDELEGHAGIAESADQDRRPSNTPASAAAGEAKVLSIIGKCYPAADALH